MTFEDGRPKLTHLDVKDGGLLLFAPVEVGLVRDRTRETRRPKPPANADDRKQRAKVLEVIAVDGTSGTGSSWRRRVCCVGHVGHRRRGSYERAPAEGCVIYQRLETSEVPAQEMIPIMICAFTGRRGSSCGASKGRRERGRGGVGPLCPGSGDGFGLSQSFKVSRRFQGRGGRGAGRGRAREGGRRAGGERWNYQMKTML